MKRLVLLRHAKSSQGSARQDDHERAIHPRGERAAAAVGVFLAQEGVRPELVLCSSARRTLETWRRVGRELGGDPELSIERELYLAPAPALLERLRRVDDAVSCVLVVGHNPGTEDLARALAGRGDAQALAQLREKFPTAAVADLRIRSHRWSDLAPGVAELRSFATPKELV
jgi:phosphohistidine phosphatase